MVHFYQFVDWLRVTLEVAMLMQVMDPAGGLLFLMSGIARLFVDHTVVTVDRDRLDIGTGILVGVPYSRWWLVVPIVAYWWNLIPPHGWVILHRWWLIITWWYCYLVWYGLVPCHLRLEHGWWYLVVGCLLWHCGWWYLVAG